MAVMGPGKTPAPQHSTRLPRNSSDSSVIEPDLRPLILALWIIGASIFAAMGWLLHFRFPGPSVDVFGFVDGGVRSFGATSLGLKFP
jgi:hypothetical protein